MKKVKRFAMGGLSSGMTGSSNFSLGNGSSSAQDGISQINSGADAVNKSLDQISQAIGTPSQTGAAATTNVALGSSSGNVQGGGGVYPNASTGMKFKAGGKVSSASKRGDGIAQRGKTRGTMVMCKGGKT